MSLTTKTPKPTSKARGGAGQRSSASLQGQKGVFTMFIISLIIAREQHGYHSSKMSTSNTLLLKSEHKAPGAVEKTAWQRPSVVFVVGGENLSVAAPPSPFKHNSVECVYHVLTILLSGKVQGSKFQKTSLEGSTTSTVLVV
jgi:hypothetical protein